MNCRDAERGEARLELDRLRVHAARDRGEPVRPVVHGVERGDVGQERLRGADVRRRLLAPDVLLARLDRHPVGGVALRVDRDADETAGHLANVGVARGEEGRVRAAVAERHAEALRAADDDVGAHLARRRHQRARQEIGGDDRERLRLVDAGDDRRKIADQAVGVRRLHEHAEDLRSERRVLHVDDAQLEAERLGACREELERLREGGAIGEEDARVLARADAMRERHPFGGGRGLVEQRRVGDVHRGEVLHRGLEVEERLEPPLRDLGLVGRVGRVPAGVLEHVAQDDGRRHRVVVAQADERAEHLVLRRDRPQAGEVVVLALGLGQRQRIACAGWPAGSLRRGAPRATARRSRPASRPARPGSARCAGRRSRARWRRLRPAPVSVGSAGRRTSAHERGVGGGVEQRAELAGVRRAHLDDPGDRADPC